MLQTMEAGTGVPASGNDCYSDKLDHDLDLVLIGFECPEGILYLIQREHGW